jgi:hypothetical protein
MGPDANSMGNQMMNGMQNQMAYGFPNQNGFVNNMAWNPMGGMPNMMGNGNFAGMNMGTLNKAGILLSSSLTLIRLQQHEWHVFQLWWQHGFWWRF